MAGMMTFLDGNIEAVMNYDDFVFFVGKYMGQEAKDYVKDMVTSLVYYEENQEDIDEMKKMIDDLTYRYKTMEQDYRDIKAQLEKEVSK